VLHPFVKGLRIGVTGSATRCTCEGRRAGSQPGFAYSDALRKSAIVWNEKALDAWLVEPEKLVPGHMMNVQVDDAKAREDLVAFLRALKAN